MKISEINKWINELTIASESYRVQLNGYRLSAEECSQLAKLLEEERDLLLQKEQKD